MIAIKPNHEDFKMMRELVRDFSMKVKYIGFPANQLLFCQQLTDVLFCYGIDSSIRFQGYAQCIFNCDHDDFIPYQITY